MNQLSPTQRRALRAEAHPLNPVVSIADKGLSPSVLKEIDVSLKAHALIKVRLYDIERDERARLLDEICAELGCFPVQSIGKILVLWRPKPEADEASAPRRRKTAAPKTKKEAAAALARKNRKS